MPLRDAAAAFNHGYDLDRQCLFLLLTVHLVNTIEAAVSVRQSGPWSYGNALVELYFLDMRSPIFWIASQRLSADFPDPAEALEEPAGLLALGGDLGTERLVTAYQSGIFPWYQEGEPILWWSPDPRAILWPGQLHISRSLRRRLRQGAYRVSVDLAFPEVIRGCAAPRKEERGTWLSAAMIDAYIDLHHRGHAYSIEAWHEGELVGGVYGVTLGQVFFGESMFSRIDDASKVCLVYLSRYLSQWGYRLIDCQVFNPHLERLGAIRIPRAEFVRMLRDWCNIAARPEAWQISA
jgi:leucyl/phenylalanyl-tRNA--protein transferase